jgi:hypothetical protein
MHDARANEPGDNIKVHGNSKLYYAGRGNPKIENGAHY